MRLNETALSGRPLHECDVCRIAGGMDSYIVEEGGRDLCLPCWYESIKQRPAERESVLGA